MNKNLITNKNIYLASDENITFYISIPKEKKVNILINILDDTNNINMNTNNIESITKEVDNIYSKFHFSDIAIVTPILDSNLIQQIKLNNDEKVFKYTDKVLGYIINKSYEILKENELEIDKKIKLNNNHTLEEFNKWFIDRYDGRVELVNYNTAPVNIFDNVSNITPENNEANKLANEVLENTSNLNAIKEEPETTTKEPGFVSYVLLGVIVAVVVLAILYKLL